MGLLKTLSRWMTARDRHFKLAVGHRLGTWIGMDRADRLTRGTHASFAESDSTPAEPLENAEIDQSAPEQAHEQRDSAFDRERRRRFSLRRKH